jgi:hypothetical protein
LQDFSKFIEIGIFGLKIGTPSGNIELETAEASEGLVICS